MEGNLEQMETTALEQPKSMSALSGVTKVLFSPRQVFDSVREKPNWILPLCVVVILTVIVGYIVFPVALAELPERLKEIPQLTEEQKQQALEQAQGGLVLGSVIDTAILIILYFVIAGVFFFVANILLGGEGKFTQTLSITGLSQLVMIPEDLIKVPLILAKQTLRVHTDLSLFLPSALEGSFIFRLFSQLDIFTFWKVFLIGMGIAIVYKFATKKAMTAVFTVWGIYVLIAALMGKFLKFGMS
jgi:hypothetical protein